MNSSPKAILNLTLAATFVAAYMVCFAASPQTRVQVPFVGCPADGQVGYIDPPDGTPRSVTLREVPVETIAYYKGAHAPGAFAPRGWHCHVWYGSSGAVLVVTPQLLDSAPGSAWPPKTGGFAVELRFDDGGTSGRFEVAKYALLFFPGSAAQFIQEVNGLLDIKISQRSLQAFAKDSVKAISNSLGEFVTPSNSEGFGTEQFLKASSEPITGVVFLDQSLPEWPNLVALRMRLSPTEPQLKSALLRLNRECMEDKNCSTR